MILFLEGSLWLFRFILGACVFSFLHALAWRLPRGESILDGRSRCPCCQKPLSARELVPCISYFVQRGKCKHCGFEIPKRYVLAEYAGGLFFVCCAVHFGCGSLNLISLQGLLAFVYLGILFVIALIDWETCMIYDRFQVGIFLLGIAALWLFPERSLTDRLAGMAVVALPMLILALFAEGAFGGGDIKLMAVSGFLLGWRAIVAAMFFGLLTGGGYAIRMLAQKKLDPKSRMPFGPFLAVGLAAGLFFGEQAADWYLSIL